VDKFPNLLVTQTLSKSRSLAGLRIGFAVGHTDLIAGLERIKDSFNSYPLDSLAITAGVAAFEDQTYFEETCQKVIKGRKWVVRELEALGFIVLPSAANFVFATHPQNDAAELSAGLRKQGVIVRHFKQQKTEQYLRITIGTTEENQQLLAVMDTLI
ncbi:MAG: aminotransferase class I/II-fold pyridoxal phosphate-dependent enzyme, partial [Pseudomonadota bacterium]|nr:aminotransferase class I/II-fold pyridoxal phosphate-dependent enzyme [Pseudomonadota bacterium]